MTTKKPHILFLFSDTGGGHRSSTESIIEALGLEFGDRITFWGGIDTQKVLCRGTTADVRREVRDRINAFAPGGGYVLCAVHNIQREVPPENIDAMYDEALKSGVYPIAGK